MSATLTKEPKAGAREAQPASVELPEAVSPAKKRLAEALGAFEKATADLSDARGHLARAETDKAAALESVASDSEDRLAVAIRSESIYSARVTSRGAAQTKLLVELKAAANLAHNEHGALWSDLLTKRQDIVRARIIEAGQLVGRFEHELEVLLESSALIQDVRGVQINSGALLFCDNAEQITGIARKILAGYESIAAKMKEQI